MTLSDVERAAGLSEPLPAGERIVWQGKPDPRRLSREIFHLRWLGGYFAAAAVVIAVTIVRDGRPLGQGIAAATLMVPVAALALGLLAVLGRVTAGATTYTLTDRRLILHIGVAYEMTVSVPLSAVRGASLRRRGAGFGDVALAVADAGGAGYVALWPHVRPWRALPPQPMLRALPDVEAVAERIGDALVAFNAAPRAPRPMPATPAVPEAAAA